MCPSEHVTFINKKPTCVTLLLVLLFLKQTNKADWEQGFGEREAKKNSKHYTANKLVVEQKRKSGNETLCGKM